MKRVFIISTVYSIISYLFSLMNILNVHSNCSLKKMKSICLPIILIFLHSANLSSFFCSLSVSLCVCSAHSLKSPWQKQLKHSHTEILPPPPCLHLLSVRQLFLVDHLQNVRVHPQFTLYLGSL